jgi:hypothetical protein
MTKRTIKIIKRDDASSLTQKPEPTAEATLIREEKDRVDGERDMVNAVSGWITDRSKNRKAEETEASQQLFSWDGGDTTEPA